VEKYGGSDKNVHRPLIGKTKEKFNEKVFFPMSSWWSKMGVSEREL
jgi:hypothetical protein